MRSLTVFLVAASLLGCKSDPDETDPVIIEDTDDDDIPDTFLGRTAKPSDVERSGQSLRAGLVAVTVESSGAWTLGPNLGGGKLSGTGNFGIELPKVAPSDQIRDLPGGRRGALYLPMVYDDTDLDEVFTDNDDDFVMGLAKDRWLVFIESGLTGEDTGWQVVDPTTDSWAFYRLTEQAEVRLHGLSAVARLEGIYEGEREGVGVVAIDERWPGGDGINDWTPLDVMVSAENGQFDDQADSRPPVEAFQFPADVSLRMVRAKMRYYVDTDGSGSFDPALDELLDEGLCYEGEPLILRFSDTPRTVALAREIGELEWTTGWRFVTGAYGASTEVERGDLRWTRYGDGCAL